MRTTSKGHFSECTHSISSWEGVFQITSEFSVFHHFFSPELDQPPVAHVVSSPPIVLPVRTATLDGSHSIDDKGGVSYLWARDDSSPAAGVRLAVVMSPLNFSLWWTGYIKLKQFHLKTFKHLNHTKTATVINLVTNTIHCIRKWPKMIKLLTLFFCFNRMYWTTLTTRQCCFWETWWRGSTASPWL